MQRLKAGLIGVGRLGSVHLEHLLQSPHFDLIGCFDSNPLQAARIAEDYPVTCFDNVDDLIAASDVIDIVTPAGTHYYYAEKALRQSKHVFIEKPITEDLIEAERIVELAREANSKVQVGHIERFNPVYKAAQSLMLEPMFIEAHRLAPFDPRGTDVSVVLDLMIHDIDLVLNMVKANIKNISANGVAVISREPDIANARIEFDNGCVANLTASRVSMQKMRKLRLFQKNAYMSLDFLQREAEYITLDDEQSFPSIPLQLHDTVKYVHARQLPIENYDAIRAELDAFALAIIQQKPTAVSAEDAYMAMDVAYKIMGKIRKNGNFMMPV
jgi:predicted dehydrogenase